MATADTLRARRLIETRRTQLQTAIDKGYSEERVKERRDLLAAAEKALADLTGPVTTLPVPAAPAPVQTPAAPAPSTPTPTPGKLPAGPAWGWAPVPTIDLTNAVKVTDAKTLQAALDAKSKLIALAPGTYAGRFAGRGLDGLTLVGTGATPLDTLLDGGDYRNGYGLGLTDSPNARLVNFAVKGSEKGVMLDNSDHVEGSHLDLGFVGMETLHYRNDSDFGWLHYSHLHDTGFEKPDYAEAVYIGSAKSNLTAKTNTTAGKADTSDTFLMEYCSTVRVRAEHVDSKEGTTGGVVRYCRIDVTGMGTPDGKVANFADSPFDLKGNEWQVYENEITGSSPVTAAAVQTHVNEVDGVSWGHRHVIRDNYGDVRLVPFHEDGKTPSRLIEVDKKSTGVQVSGNFAGRVQ